MPAGLPVPPAQVDMAIVVLAYGIDFATGTFAEVYSEPLIVTEPFDLIPIWYE